MTLTFSSPAVSESLEAGRAIEGEAAHKANNFDILRLISALLVIYGHSYPLTGLPEPGFAASGVATIGVKIFFVISGYLVALSWLRDSNLEGVFSGAVVYEYSLL